MKIRALQDFNLRKGDNSAFTSADWQGRWLFFGFTCHPGIGLTTKAQQKQFYDKQAKTEIADES